MAKLTKEQRAKLRSSQFVFPKTRSYPIPDKGHAQWAMRIGAIQFSRGNLSQSQYNAIVQAVNTKFGFNAKYKKSQTPAMKIAA